MHVSFNYVNNAFIVTVHQFMLMSNFLNNIFFDLNFQNVVEEGKLQQTTSIENYILPFWGGSFCILTVFHDRLFYSNRLLDKDRSWDIKSGETFQHGKLEESVNVYDFAFTVVNGKLWRTGGLVEDEGAIMSTFFLDSDFNWADGPDLPQPKESHTMLALNDNEVIIFGGNLQGFARASASLVWIYNDEHGNFTTMGDFKLGSRPSVALTYIEDIGKEVVLVLIKNEAYFYDWLFDAWIQADETWIHPIAQLERIKLFVSDNRYYLNHLSSAFKT